jgi:CheY-like chemotaxis protein
LGAKVLVVDDEKDIRDSLKQVLEFEGFEVLTASDGADALKLLNQVSRPAVIILDLMMPGMNGFEFIEVQQHTAGIDQVPVIVVSADPELRKKAPQLHANRVMRKPIAIDTLIKWIQDYSTKKPSAEKASD